MKRQENCAYQRRDGTRCPEERLENSEHCFWHDVNVPKTGPDIKERLEAKAKEDPNCEGYVLHKADLHDIWLTETIFDDAVFSKAILTNGHLYGISLNNANLFKADFSRATMHNAKLQDADMLGIIFENTKLAKIEWGEQYIILQEKLALKAKKQGNVDESREKMLEAEEIYLALKKYCGNTGLSKEEGLFFYREMVAKRHCFPLFSMSRLGYKLADISCGYGEKVGRILGFSVQVILFSAIVYFFTGFQGGGAEYKFSTDMSIPEMIDAFAYAFYYSNVTFTTLGYGDYSPISPVSRFLAGIESFFGAFLVALFVITVYKRIMER